MFAKCGRWPRHPSEEWGFTACAGLAAYRYSPKTLALLEYLYGRCLHGCDDQKILNWWALHEDLKIEWQNHTSEDRKSVLEPEIYGSTKQYLNLSIGLFPEKLVPRGHGHLNCHTVGNAWIASPNYAKSAVAKAKMFKLFDECMQHDNDSFETVR